MKNLVMFVLGSVMAATSAQATSPMRTSFAYLDQVYVSENHASLRGASHATILVNHSLQKVRLNVFVPINCPAGQACIAVVPAPVQVELPIARAYEDSCGSYHYEAATAQPIPGGTMEHIDVIDNTSNRCLTYVALPATEVLYSTTAAHPGFQGGVSRFSGDALSNR